MIAGGWPRVIRFLLNFFLLYLALAENKQREAQKDSSGNYQYEAYNFGVHLSDPSRI